MYTEVRQRMSRDNQDKVLKVFKIAFTNLSNSFLITNNFQPFRECYLKILAQQGTVKHACCKSQDDTINRETNGRQV